MSNSYTNEDQSASPFNSPMINKERSNSIQLSLGNGVASIFLPITFSQDNINDLMNLASKFEFEEEENDDYFEENKGQRDAIMGEQAISLSLCSNNCSQVCN